MELVARGFGMRVLFIAGWGRSGSTLLDTLLGQARGVHSGGEIRYVWDRGLIENRPCSCGARFRECELWHRVAEPFLSLSESELRALVAGRDRLRVRDCWRRGRVRSRLGEDVVARYTNALRGLYERLFAATGARVVVDSSKFPSHGVLLERAGVDVTVLHLVRDPRAVAYSWSRRRVYDRNGDGTRSIRRQGPFRSTSYWTVWNRVVERLWADREADGRYLRLRYEDLVASPREALKGVFEAVGIAPDLSCLTASNTARLEPSHLPSGNPGRFRTGEVPLVLDDEWRRRLPSGSRRLVALMALPLLRAYGYADDRSS